MVKPTKSSGCSGSGEKPGKKKKKEKDKFSVYDFGPEDERVEKESEKRMSKFNSKCLLKFSRNSPVGKYSFLGSFARGAKAESYSKTELLNIEDSDDNPDEMTCNLDAPRSLILSNPELSAHSPLGRLDFEYHSDGARSCLCERINPGGRSSYHALLKSYHPQVLTNNQLLCVDSDDDQINENMSPISVDSHGYCRTQMGSLNSASNVARNEGSSYDGSNTRDMEAVVIVKPDIIIFGEMYSTSASLLFSDRCIKIEGILGGTEKPFSFSWSISNIVKVESSWYGKVETARVELYLKSCDEKLAITDDNVSEVLKLNFAIRDPCWSRRQEDIKSLDTIYKATWKTVVDSNKAFEGIFYPQGDHDAVPISMKDIQLLQPATFINDTIIDFYINYLKQRLKLEKKPRFHFFNSFFFRKLVDLDKSPSRASDGRAAFQRVSKWTRKVNLFKKDYLFIPVNFSLHWSLIVVCHPGEVPNYEEKEMKESFKLPCILHMDSIKGSHRGFKNHFQSYLLEEWRERHKMPSEDVSAKFLNLPFISLELPQQENSFDCGLFLLYFVERFLEEAPINFNPYTATSKFLNKEWFPPAEASGRRDYIKNILYRIFNDNVQTDPLITNDYDSSCKEIDGGSSKELLCGASSRRDLINCSTPNVDKNIQRASRETTSETNLQQFGGLHLAPGDSLDQGDAGRSSPEGTYQHCRQSELLKRFCNTLSPIEEEPEVKQTAFPSVKASTSLAETSVHYEHENMKTTSETRAVKFPCSIEIRDEDNLAPEVLLISASDETIGAEEIFTLSSEENLAQVIEDSYESGVSLNDNENHHSTHEAKTFAISDQEVNSPYITDVKSDDYQPFERSVEERDATTKSSL